MLSSSEIRRLFEKINDVLAERGARGEIGLVGGAAMCLVYNARAATKDVDAVFEPAQIIRDIAQRIAEEESLPSGWLNDGAKGFLTPGFVRQDVLRLSNLLVWTPEPRYLLAMKCISARWDTSDRDDVIYLLHFLGINNSEEVFSLIDGYYPGNSIPPRTKFFIEEILAG